MKFETISPVDGQVFVTNPYSTAVEIEMALSSATKAAKSWRSTSIEERKIICQKAVEYFQLHVDDIGKEITYQMGRPIRYSNFEITKGFKERADYMIEIAEEVLQPITPRRAPGFERFIKREALGTVFVLAPWNYPYLTSVNAIIPAIMAGNSVILKHATQTPLCAHRYLAAFRYAGLPEGVFQYLHLQHRDVNQIIKDRSIDFVAFTGSVNGGAAVQKALGERFINAGMELGGKDPAYVREDAPIEATIENLVDGAFFNSGQSCCGIERIYVHEDRFDEFVEGFVSLTRQYQLGNPLLHETTLGPMVRSKAAHFVRDQIKKAQADGAQLHIDATDFPTPDPDTAYLAPQVLTRVDHNMDIMTEETFGPVVGIMSVTSDDEAIRLMNDSQYGLTASIWTKDIERAKQLGDLIETGTVFMNRCDYLDPALAWTGVKNSGRGCTLSVLGYESLTRPKSFHLRQEI